MSDANSFSGIIRIQADAADVLLPSTGDATLESLLDCLAHQRNLSDDEVPTLGVNRIFQRRLGRPVPSSTGITLSADLTRLIEELQAAFDRIT